MNTDKLRDRHMAKSSAAEMGGVAHDSDQPSSLAAVYTCVAVACMGALAFGYHLAVVNGPLAQIAADLGFAGNKALEGLVRPRHDCCTGLCSCSAVNTVLAMDSPRKCSLRRHFTKRDDLLF